MGPLSVFGFVTCTLVLLTTPAKSASLPGIGNGDALCMVTSGPTVCTVNEGQSDLLVELLINQLNQAVTLNAVTAGPISAAVPDPTDVITSDPIGFSFPGYNGAPACNPPVTVLAVGGGSCYFVQSFTTSTPGDPDDNRNIPNDGTSNMSFIFTFTPVAPATPVGPFSCSNGQGTNIGFCSVVQNPNGSFSATVESAVVHVNDVTPEPSTLLFLNTGLLVLGFVYRKSIRRQAR